MHENRFSTVWPALAETLESVNISNQTITDIVATVDLRDMTDDGFFSTLPSIIFYNPETHTYEDNIKIGVQSQTNWGTFYVNYNGSNDFTITGNCTWKGASGDVAKCSYTDSNNKTTNFNANFYYDMGDVDFNGQINVSDLQQSINYLFRESYYPNARYNFTAGDLNADNSINVLDVVGEVDILLAADMPTTTEAKGTHAAEERLVSASLYCKDGKLIINTVQPVAALDIVLTSTHFSPLTSLHFMTASQRPTSDGRLHLVIYNTAGKTLPVGETVIGTVVGDGYISNAMLVDEEAKEISTALNNPNAQVVTGISGVSGDSGISGTSEIYDLQGRKIADNPSSLISHPSSKKGVYIVNGKKVIIK